MELETVTVPTEIVIPNLDREEVTNRSDGIPYIEYEAYGTYKLALSQFRAEAGQKNNPHFRADCIVVESTCEAYPVGRDVSIHFPTGRQGTPTDPGKKERDDERIARFVCSVFRKEFADVKAKRFSATDGAKKLLAAGKLPEGKRPEFVFVRSKGKTDTILDRKTKQLREVTYPSDRFEMVK